MRTCLLSRWYLAAAFGLAMLLGDSLLAQIPAPNNVAAQNGPQNQNVNAAPFPGLGGQQQNGFMFGPGAMGNQANRGASANADFDSLIDLIVSTVATETWSENGGGEAEVRPFPNGVMVDTAGMMRLKTKVDALTDISVKRGKAAPKIVGEPGKPSKASALRYISLPRLEKEILRRQAAHLPLDASMLTLAGLQRVRYVFVYPESGDLVLAGPAGDWKVEDGRIVSNDTLDPVVRLDDLLTLMRRGPNAADSHFGCSINPRQAALAKTQAFLASSNQKPLEPGQRKKWLGDLRDTVGKQDIEFFGIDPSSRVAKVLVEADYHMKLVGMGLADGVDGVESYLQSIHLRPGEQPPAMSVLRWWFTLNYKNIPHSEANDAFELVGQGVKVLSENEMLAAQGQRVHTGQSDPLNRQFAESFTDHFDELAKKYSVYGELRNVFDLAMAVAVIQSEGLADKVDWKPTLIANADKLRLPQGAVPREVETVINHRVINQRTILAGVSGGVMVAPGDVLKATRAGDSAGATVERAASAPKDLSAEAWWWDTK